MNHPSSWIRRSIVCITILYMSWTGSALAAAPADPLENELMQEQIKQLPVDPVEQYWNELLQQYGGYFPERQPPSFMEIVVPGGEGISIQYISKGLLQFFFHEILYNGKLIVSIVILTVFSMILETLQSAFERKAVSKVAYAISYMVLIVIVINSFSSAILYAKSAIESMIHFMIAMIPLLLTLLASMGNITTVTVLHPLIIFMIHTVGTLIYVIVFPLLFFSAVLHIVSSISEKYKVTQLANLLRSISMTVLALSLTVFLGVISVQGVSTAAADGVVLRTAKYVTGNFVPVVGHLFSDATDTVIGASLLVKNAIGLAGVFIIVLLCAFPAIKILVLALIYNLAAAILQPLGESPIVTCLQTVGKSVIYIFAALASVALMFFLAITMLIAAGNVSVMMR